MAKVGNVTIQGQSIDPDRIDVAFRAVRAHADLSPYGKLFSDKECREVATEVVVALAAFDGGEQI